MPSPHPEPEPHLNDRLPKPPTAWDSPGGSPLLRICWLLLGCSFLVIFGFILFVVLFKEPNPPAIETAEKAIPSQAEEPPSSPKLDDAPQKESQPIDSIPSASDRHRRSDRVERVLGSGFHAPERENVLPIAVSPPPQLPPPSSKAQSAAPPQANLTDTEFEKRLQMSAEDLRKQLQKVPELRLFSDLVVQNFREKEKNDESTVKGVPRDQIDFTYNAQMHNYMRQAGLKEGLPLLSGPSCLLDPDTAMVVQTLSKDLRSMGFVSVPGTTPRRSGSPKDKRGALEQWCDVNAIEKFRGALATLVQMLQVEDTDTRLILVRELAKADTPESTAVLAMRAMVDLSSEVRQAAVAALEKRPAAQYVLVLLQGLRYPWQPVADHAALALRKLKPQGIENKLIELLDHPDPALPAIDQRTKKPMVRELVRLNHMRNCLLCHAPSANAKDGLVRGLTPTPGQPLPRLYYAGQKGNYVRADTTFLRQDFSVNMPAIDVAPWPKEQRYDFVTRLRPAKPEEMTNITSKPVNYPQRDAVLYALRGLTGKDGGDSPAKWREMLDIATRK